MRKTAGLITEPGNPPHKKTMITIPTVEGKLYAVSATTTCTITSENGTVIGTAEPGNQFFFQAQKGGTTTLSDDAAEYSAAVFKCAPIGLLGGGNSGGGDSQNTLRYVFEDNGTYSVEGVLSSLVDAAKMSEWNALLPSLKNGAGMFNYSRLTSFSSDLPALTNGSSMFHNCSNLTSFSGDLPNLTNGNSMFRYSGLTSFSIDMPALTIGDMMFEYNSKLTSFSGDLPALTNALTMFYKCTKLSSFSGDLSALTNGSGMFFQCTKLSSFSGDLSALSNGSNMFFECQLDKTSALRVLNSIPTYTSGTHALTIGIHIDNQNDEDVLAAINAATAKGWTVTTQWNGTATT